MLSEDLGSEPTVWHFRVEVSQLALGLATTCFFERNTLDFLKELGNDLLVALKLEEFNLST